MNLFYFVDAPMSESDKRLLIATFIILIILFILIGLIGMAIRKIMQSQGKRIDAEVADAVRFRVIEDSKHFRRYARLKNQRLFYKQALPPVLILLSSLIFYLIYAGVTNNWTHNYWADFGTIFFLWDFGDADSYAVFWGMRLLAKWPPITNEPHIVMENYASYILCTLWIIGSLYLLIVAQAYFSRMIMISHRASTVYNKSLDGYNYYDSIYPTTGAPNPYIGGNISERTADPHASINPTAPSGVPVPKDPKA